MRALLCGVRGSTAAPGSRVRRGRRAHVVRRHPGRRRSVDRARRRHRSAPARRRARRAAAPRLDPVQPPPLGSHPRPALPPQRRPARRRGHAVGPSAQRRSRPPGGAGPGDVAAALPDHARPAARDVDLQRHGARATPDRRRRRGHPADRPQGRASPSGTGSTAEARAWRTSRTTARRSPGRSCSTQRERSSRGSTSSSMAART